MNSLRRAVEMLLARRRRQFAQLLLLRQHRASRTIACQWRLHVHTRNSHAATALSRHWRGYSDRRTVASYKHAVVTLQSHRRGVLVRRDVSAYRHAVVTLQAHHRAVLARRRVAAIRRAVQQAILSAVQCVAHVIGPLTQGQYRLVQAMKRRAATVIQAAFRRCAGYQRFVVRRAAAVNVSRVWRGHVCRRRVWFVQNTVKFLTGVSRVSSAAVAAEGVAAKDAAVVAPVRKRVR